MFGTPIPTAVALVSEAGGAQTGRRGGTATVRDLPGGMFSPAAFFGLFVCRYGQTTSQILSEAKELA
jgi:hypothetical protein